MKQPSSRFLGTQKNWLVVEKGKVISKHNSFYNAQLGVERHFKNNKITNNYEIVSLNEFVNRTRKSMFGTGGY